MIQSLELLGWIALGALVLGILVMGVVWAIDTWGD